MSEINLTKSKFTDTVIARFVIRHTVISAVFLAILFGIFVMSKSYGYVIAYQTTQERLMVAPTFASNISAKVFFGTPNHIETVSGFAVWNTLGIMTLIGAVWALMISTKKFRGEEDAGRMEILLSGLTNSKLAAINILSALFINVFILFFVTFVLFFITGQLHNIDFLSTGDILFFAVSAICGAAMFMSFGAFMSQIWPTRGKALGIGSAILGIFFLIRAASDITNTEWLLNLTPLGWVEKLQPFADKNYLYFLPIIFWIILFTSLTFYIANNRDLNDAVFADHDTAKPHTFLLNNSLFLGVRLNRIFSFSWIIVVILASFFFSALTDSATKAFADSSAGLQTTLSKFVEKSSSFGALTYLGIIFFMILLIIMTYTASALSRIRNEEAQGYVDNMLVRSVSRMSWLFGRILMIVLVVFLMCVISALAIWFGGVANTNLNITFDTIFNAGINMIPSAMFLLGLGVFAIGFLPRYVGFLTYGVIAWSFLIQMLSSGINLNEMILNTSLFHHIALAPAVDPNWNTNFVLIIIAVVLIILGAVRFNTRDLQSE